MPVDPTPASAALPGLRPRRPLAPFSRRLTALAGAAALLLTTALTLGAVSTTPASAVGAFDGTPTFLTHWGTGTTTAPPTELTDRSRVIVDVAAGWDHALAVTADGRLWAWGGNSEKQGTVPASLKDGSYQAVAAGAQFSVALTTAGKVVAWGTNWAQQVTVPAAVKNRTIVAISAGTAHVVAQADDGKLFAWGDNDYGEGEIPGWVQSAGVTGFDCGGAFTVATTADHKVIAWGDNSAGQLFVPSSLTGKTVEEISAGTRHALALTSDGKVTAWGDNSAGELDLPAAQANNRWLHVSAGNDLSVGATSRTSAPVSWGKTTGMADAPYMAFAPATFEAGDGFALAGYAELKIASGGSITGSGRVGEPLTGTFATFSPLEATSKTGQWRDHTTQTTVATGQTFVPRPEDVGHRILFDTVGTRAGYDLWLGVDSPGITVQPGVMTISAPRLEGEAKVGELLQAAVDVVPHSDDVWFDWHWGGAYRKTSWDGRLVVPEEALGQVITVKVTAKQPGYLDAYAGEISTSTVVVAADPDPGEDPDDPTDPGEDPDDPGHDPDDPDDPGHGPDDPGQAGLITVSRTVTVSGTARVGQVLTATAPVTTPSGTTTFQWLRDGSPVARAASAEYRLTVADRGHRMAVRATVSSPGRVAVTRTSSPTAVVTKARLTLKAKVKGKARAGTKVGRHHGSRATVRILVRGKVDGLVTPAATILLAGKKGLKKTLGTARLRPGKTVLKVRLPRGRHRVVIKARATPSTTAAKVPLSIRVR